MFTMSLVLSSGTALIGSAFRLKSSAFAANETMHNEKNKVAKFKTEFGILRVLIPCLFYINYLPILMPDS
jgi:hypothetical protein